MKHRVGVAAGRWLAEHKIKLLPLLGLLLMSIGIGMYTLPLGVIAAGIGCFIFEWRISEVTDRRHR